MSGAVHSDEVHDFTSALINCFLSEEEIVWWQSGGIFPDPWPANISRLNRRLTRYCKYGI
ncbi:hypothetical protein F1752_09310 [Escherichia coli]|nr:hypothetical protein F1752_09310 [Escherichia coli]